MSNFSIPALVCKQPISSSPYCVINVRYNCIVQTIVELHGAQTYENNTCKQYKYMFSNSMASVYYPYEALDDYYVCINLYKEI